MHFQLFAAAAGGMIVLVPMISGHMAMSDPPALKAKNNPNTKNVDSSMTSPLSTSGSDYPCKGYHKLLNTDEGKPVTTWAAVSTQHFSIEGGAAHGGGSCQASLSYDGGNTFKVLKSYQGGCPTSAGGTFDFQIPAAAPSAASALFAWTWFNQIGNREMYMNCAVVGISGGQGGDLSALPDVFKANIGNGCTTMESVDLVFPDPGTDVANVSTKPGLPKGNCAQGNGSSAVPAMSASNTPGTPSAPIGNIGLPSAVPAPIGNARPIAGIGGDAGGTSLTFDDGLYHPSSAFNSGRTSPSGIVDIPTPSGMTTVTIPKVTGSGSAATPQSAITPSLSPDPKAGFVGAPGAGRGSSSASYVYPGFIGVPSAAPYQSPSPSPALASSASSGSSGFIGILGATPSLPSPSAPTPSFSSAYSGFIGVPGASPYQPSPSPSTSSSSSALVVDTLIFIETKLITFTLPPISPTLSPAGKKGKSKITSSTFRA